MGDKIWNEGEEWNASEYNRRLSNENKEIDRVDKEIRKLKLERDKNIKKIWER